MERPRTRVRLNLAGAFFLFGGAAETKKKKGASRELGPWVRPRIKESEV